MVTKVHTATVNGVDGLLVEAEIDVALGLPGYHLVGLPTTSVQEGRVRIRAALAASGFEVPPRKFTINLAPADLRKDGAAFDLPIALGLLAAVGLLDRQQLEGRLFVGELSLDGELRPIRGAIPIAAFADRQGYREIVVPPANRHEAEIVAPGRVASPRSLREVVAHLRGERTREACEPPRAPPALDELDLGDVRGQELGKRALLVAAAGGHHLLLLGPPGSGKTMLARRLPGLLPALGTAELVDTLTVYSVAGLLAGAAASLRRPFRAPHHTISPAGLVGGSSPIRPGEISLAHNGVLFLDELPEFGRIALEALREPLEEGRLTIARARSVATLPARFQLVAAANPCPCGYYGSAQRNCRCSLELVRRYQARLSGPMLDRIDLHVAVTQPGYRELRAPGGSGESARVRARVEAARERQRARYRDAGVRCNAHLPARLLEVFCPLGGAAERLLERAMASRALGARAVARALRVARTLADLDDEERIQRDHVAEALALRALDEPPSPARMLDSYAPPAPPPAAAADPGTAVAASSRAG